MNRNSISVKKLLLRENSKKLWDSIADMVINNEIDLEDLIKYFNGTDLRLIQRSSQCISKIYDKAPHLINPYLSQFIQSLSPNNIDAYNRNVFRILQTSTLPEEQHSNLLEHCFDFINRKSEPIAVQAFAITVLRRLCQVYPELSKESYDIINLLLEETESTGLLNRGKKELFKLNKIIESKLNKK